MPRKKLTINATDEQIQLLKAALANGTPISIALQYAGISNATYYYWVAIYSVALVSKEQEELEELEGLAQSGVSLQMCKDIAASNSPTKKMSVGTFIEPTQESLLQYKNVRKFRKFADQVYEIIADCNRIRSQVVIKHLNNIQKSTTDRRLNASGSMWFLERTMSETFGRAADKAKIEETTPAPIGSVTVEFVDPNTDDSKERLEEMEQKILHELKGSGEA